MPILERKPAKPSPTPWRATPHPRGPSIYDANGDLVCNMEMHNGDANAALIVDAVNAK